MRKINDFVVTCVTKKRYVCDTSELFSYNVCFSVKITYVT